MNLSKKKRDTREHHDKPSQLEVLYSRHAPMKYKRENMASPPSLSWKTVKNNYLQVGNSGKLNMGSGFSCLKLISPKYPKDSRRIPRGISPCPTARRSNKNRCRCVSAKASQAFSWPRHGPPTLCWWRQCGVRVVGATENQELYDKYKSN